MSNTPTTPQINTNPTPKQRFKEMAKQVSAHRELMQNDSLRESFDTALLQYHHELTLPKLDTQEVFAAAQFTHYRLMGALDFLRILRELGEKQPEFKPQVVDGIRHDV